MKKQVSLLTLTAALLLGACSTYEEVPATSGDGATAVGFLADIAPREQSRADINVDFGTGLTGTWNGEDKLGVLANDFSKLLQFTYTTDSKAFTGSLFGSAGTWAYRAFYPHNGNATVSGTTVTVPFSALRTQNGNKYNSEFDIMAADAITHNNAKPGKTPEGNAVKFNLHRITSILALKLQGGAASEKIASVMLTSKKPIASEKLTFTVPSDPNAAYDPSAINPTLVAEGTSATGSPISIDSEHITVTYTDGTAPSADYSETFFNVLPDDSYGDLTFSACTDKGNAASFTITRTTPVVANWVYTVERTAPFTKAAAPTVEWIGHEDLTTPTELLESGNSADIRVSAPGGIKSMQVDITSSVLTTPMEGSEQNLLEAVNLAPSMELTNPANNDMAAALAGLGFPTPAQLQNQQYVFFQIGGLIDLLASISPTDQTTTADFKFTVTDNAGTPTEITLKFTKTVSTPILPTVTYNNDADPWTNQATLSCTVAPADFANTVIEYQRAGESEWQTADKGEQNVTDGTFTATIKSGYNADNTMISATGIRPGYKYTYRLTINGDSKASGTIDMTPVPGDEIENSGMENWSTTTVSGSTGIVYPNASGKNFWTSGNNGQTPSLCKKSSDIWADNTTGSSCAYMESTSKAKIFAAGNLFTGTFSYTFSITGWSGGTASLGSSYNWTARPTALRVKVKANVDKITNVGKNPDGLTTSDNDPARIFVCICNRDEQLSTVSQIKVIGMSYNISGTFEPTDSGVGILAYGDHKFSSSTNGWETITIPIIYNDRDTTQKPTKTYSIFISCSASSYGAYFCGSTKNKLWVDDFEWVY